MPTRQNALEGPPPPVGLSLGPNNDDGRRPNVSAEEPRSHSSWPCASSQASRHETRWSQRNAPSAGSKGARAVGSGGSAPRNDRGDPVRAVGEHEPPETSGPGGARTHGQGIMSPL